MHFAEKKFWKCQKENNYKKTNLRLTFLRNIFISFFDWSRLKARRRRKKWNIKKADFQGSHVNTGRTGRNDKMVQVILKDGAIKINEQLNVA